MFTIWPFADPLLCYHQNIIATMHIIKNTNVMPQKNTLFIPITEANSCMINSTVVISRPPQSPCPMIQSAISIYKSCSIISSDMPPQIRNVPISPVKSTKQRHHITELTDATALH